MGEATDRFIDEITNLLRQAKLNDLMELGREVPAPAVQVEEPVAEVPPRQPETEPLVKNETPAPTTPATNPRKTRTWPTCSTPGCTRKMYPSSGSKRLCYQHHLEAGGKPSPFAGKRSKAGQTDEGAQAAVESHQGVQAGADGPREQEQAMANLEAPTGTEPTMPPASTSMRSLKALRRSAVDPTVVVRGKGTNGRSTGTGAGAGTGAGTKTGAGVLDRAEALFDIPGRMRVQ